MKEYNKEEQKLKVIIAVQQEQLIKLQNDSKETINLLQKEKTALKQENAKLRAKIQ